MLRRLFGPHTTTGLAFLAGVMLATAGTAAAGRLITGTQVKDGTISAKDLTKAVRAQLKKAGLPGPQGPKGDAGAAGAKGETGPKGDQGIPGPVDGKPAGGALSGTYPNPGIAAGAIDYDQLSFFKYVNSGLTFDLGSIAAQSCVDLSTGIGDNIESDDIVLSSVTGLEQGLVTTGTAEAPTTVAIRVCNVTAAPIDPAEHDYRYTVLD
jgi:hypothetical protein